MRSADIMDTASVLFLVSLLVPPAVVAAGIVVVLWPRGRRVRRVVHIEHAVVQR
jgi:hypothetical protein